MLSQGMKIFTDIPIVVFGMGLFLFAFASVVIRTYFRYQSKEFYQKLAAMPLSEEQ